LEALFLTSQATFKNFFPLPGLGSGENPFLPNLGNWTSFWRLFPLPNSFNYLQLPSSGFSFFLGACLNLFLKQDQYFNLPSWVFSRYNNSIKPGFVTQALRLICVLPIFGSMGGRDIGRIFKVYWGKTLGVGGTP